MKNVHLALLLTFCGFFGLSCSKSETIGTASTITILSTNPVADSQVDPSQTIEFKVSYTTNATPSTSQGFSVNALFEGPNGNLYGTTNLSALSITTQDKTGVLTFNIPLSSLVGTGGSSISYPIKAYFVLGNLQADASSISLATSAKVVFRGL